MDGDEGGGGRRIAELRERIDGFTPERQRAFLDALRETGCIRDAARAAGVSTTTIDRARRNFPDFDADCRTVRNLAVPALEAIAYRRATVGAAARIIRKGRLFEVRMKPSDTMLRLLLAGAAPEKYGRCAGLAGARQATRPRGSPPERTLEEAKQSILKKLDAIDRHRVARQGYTIGPHGGLVPPGMRMVSEAELARLGWTAPDDEAPAAESEPEEGGA